MVSYRRPLFVFILLLLGFYIPDAVAIHSVSANPSGGSYSSTQFVTITATVNSTIYYTINGMDPSNSSTIYTSPIEITTNTTLKYFSISQSDNHTTDIVTESYVFDTVAPTVIETDPSDGQEAVDVNTVINVTFSKSMDESTINTDTFLIESTEGLEYFGFTTYDANSNTATFFPDILDESFTYVVTLKSEIKDLAGNSLGEDYVFTFTTGPDMGIKLFEHDPSGSLGLLGGSSFTITPDPFTLSGSLTVDDNQFPDVDPNDGSIFLNNIEFGTFVVSQTGVPSGFGNIFDNVTITAHETLLFPRAEFRNRNVTIPISDFPPAIFVGVPPPDLTSDQFELYKDSTQVGTFLGFEGGLFGAESISSVGPSEIPGGTLETLETLEHPETTLRSVLFDIGASPGTPAQELFTSFMIPTYPDIDSSIKNDTFYFVPAFVIPYGDSGNNFMLTPIIGHIRPGMTLVLEQPSYIESEEVKVERVNMTVNAAGNNVGFSFAITDERPPGTPEPPIDIPALFLDVDFVGNIEFSSPSAFESSPVIDILVNKTLPGFDELPDGCVDFRLLLLNEVTSEWNVVSQLRDPTRDSELQCGFTLFPEHFSKFAVGGVKGQTISTEESSEVRNRSGGGGGSRSTTITQTVAGSDIERTITTEAGTVILRFENIEEGTGQLKINSNDLSAFEKVFDDLVFLSQDNDEHGIVHLEGKTYSTVGSEVFDIDASSVKFVGTVNVTIPYDQEAIKSLGSEQNVRLLHHNKELDIWEDKTVSVDQDADTVTGILDSLSPVVAAIIIESDEDADQSMENSVTRLDIAAQSFSLSESNKVRISANLRNTFSSEQDYVMIVQVVDDLGIVQHIDWHSGSLKKNQNVDVYMQWHSANKGSYRAHLILVTDFESPWLLSPPVIENFRI
jgi:hypothetical protein